MTSYRTSVKEKKQTRLLSMLSMVCRIHRDITGEMWFGVDIKNTYIPQRMKNLGVCIMKLLIT